MSAKRLVDYTRIGESSINYFFYPYNTKQDYDRAFAKARSWALRNDQETSATSARIHHVKEEAL
jgi:hypothetical protein